MSDNIFVSRDNNLYQIDMTSSGSLRDTDLVLASREVNGVPTLFKVTGDKFGKAPAAPEITAVVLQQNNVNENRFTGNSFTSIVASNDESPTAPTLMTAEVEGALSIEATTEPIATNAYSASTETSVPLILDGTFNLGDVFEIGDVVLANESYTPTTSTIVRTATAMVTSNGTTATATGWGNNDFPLDGNVGTQASSRNNVSGELVFSQDLQNVTKVEVNTRFLSTGTATLSEGGTTVATKSFTGSSNQDWFTIYEGNPISFDKYEQQMNYQGVNTSDDFYAMRINDQFVVCPGGTGTVMNPITSSSASIEFEDDTDIQLFQTGDVVKGLGNEVRTYSDELQPGVFAGGSATALFNGDPGIGGTYNSYGIVTNSAQSFIFDPPIYFDGGSVNCVGYNTGGPGKFHIVIDGTEYTITLATGGTAVNNIQTGFPAGQITSFGCDSNGIGWTQVELNGQALVDGTAYGGAGGETVRVVSTDVNSKTITVDSSSYFAANQTQEWSSNVVNDRVDYPAENAFNNTGFSNIAFAPNGATTTVSFTEIPVSTLRIAINKAGPGTNGIVLNGNVDVENQLSVTDGWNTITGVTSLSSIKYKSSSGADYVGIYQVEVDGKILINTSVTPNWDTTVSPVLPKRGEGTIQGISGNSVTISPFTDNCFKEDQFLVFKTPKVIEVTPLTDPIDSFDSQTNTLTLTGDKDLSQLTNGDSVYMTDGTDPVNQDGYLLQTSSITNIVDNTVNSIDMIDRSKSGAERNDYPFTNFFDGSSSTFYYMGPDAAGLYLDIDIPAGSTVELLGNNGASDTQTVTVRYNDGATTGSFLKSSAVEWRDCSPANQTIEITNMFIETNGGYGGWCALRINGVVVGTTYTNPTELTFADPCTDLQYFKLDDVIQTSPEIKVLDIDVANRQMKVTPGGSWDVSNQSQVWSDPSNFTTSTSFYSQYPSTMLFDGNPDTTFYATGQGSSLVWDASSFFNGTGSHTVRVRMNVSLNSDQYSGDIDGTPFVMSSSSPWSEPLTVNSIGVITVRGTPNVSDGAWNAIEVDGKLLVDKVIDDYVWTDSVAGTQFGSGYSKDKAFDGNIDTRSLAIQDSDLTFTPPQAIDINDTLRIYVKVDSTGNPNVLKVNGTDYSSLITSTGSNWITIPGQTQLTELIYGRTVGAGSEQASVGAIEIDGTLLVDKGLRDTGATTVTYQTNGGQGTVDTVDVGNNSIVIVPTGDRDNRWIATNQTGTAFRVGSPTKPAISQKAYLKFNGAGVVESISAAPVAPQAMVSRNPTLIFPTEFDTNTTPDAELPNPTSLKTTISRTNELGSASKASNKLLPTTTTRSDLAAGAAATYTTDGYSEFVCMTKSHEGRAAEQRAIQYAENCQALKDAAEQVAEDYINNNP